ncbi:patatin-like phospholipase family protein [Fulvivirgaceae bacterium LMO-SS25]
MRKKIGLSLSGGGYRAAAFHLGTLRLLHKKGLLEKLNFLSTVSGGSIIGASYCQKKSEGMSFEEFAGFFTERLQKSVISRVLISFPFVRFMIALILIIAAIVYFSFFTYYVWIGLLIGIFGILMIIIFQFKLFPVSKVIEKIYDDIFYRRAVLKDLPSKPLLIINSTNLQTGRIFYFTSLKMSDSSYDGSYTNNPRRVFKHEQFPLSRAVMSSSSVPSFFTPVEISEEYFEDKMDIERIKPLLIDGGVYDNQGIHKLTHPKGEYECQSVIVSDAGFLLSFDGSYNNILTLLLRTVELFMNRIKMFQIMINLYRGNNNRSIAYITLGWDFSTLISGFVENIRNGNIQDDILCAHGLNHEDLSKVNDVELEQYIEDQINLAKILERRPSIDQQKLARSISTNLTALSLEEIEALSLYAEIMTEIQLKLYMPHLLN